MKKNRFCMLNMIFFFFLICLSPIKGPVPKPQKLSFPDVAKENPHFSQKYTALITHLRFYFSR